MKEYIEKSIVERMLWAVIMSKDERTIEEMLQDAPTVHAVPVPEGATNGDMLMTIFPDERGEHYSYLTPLHLMYDGLDFIKEFRIEWWNARYKKEVEE